MVKKTSSSKTKLIANNAKQAELTAITYDLKFSHVLESRIPVTNYCFANSGQRSWHSPLKDLKTNISSIILSEIQINNYTT